MTERLLLVRLRSRLAGPFDLAVEQGACVAIAGQSGSGKSLFLRMIADLDPNDGEARLDGQPRDSFAPPDWRRRVLYSAAEPGWWSERVLDHFAPQSRREARNLAARLGIAADRLEETVTHLSTGERQRLALVRALVLHPPVLLLDEPTGALDEAATRQVETVLCELLATGTTILLVTHSREQAQRLGQRHLTMEARHLLMPSPS